MIRACLQQRREFIEICLKTDFTGRVQDLHFAIVGDMSISKSCAKTPFLTVYMYTLSG